MVSGRLGDLTCCFSKADDVRGSTVRMGRFIESEGELKDTYVDFTALQSAGAETFCQGLGFG